MIVNSRRQLARARTDEFVNRVTDEVTSLTQHILKQEQAAAAASRPVPLLSLESAMRYMQQQQQQQHEQQSDRARVERARGGALSLSAAQQHAGTDAHTRASTTATPRQQRPVSATAKQPAGVQSVRVSAAASTSVPRPHTALGVAREQQHTPRHHHQHHLTTELSGESPEAATAIATATGGGGGVTPERRIQSARQTMRFTSSLGQTTHASTADALVFAEHAGEGQDYLYVRVSVPWYFVL